MTDARTDSIGGATPAGWSNDKPFVDYLKHFIAHERPCKEDTFDFRLSRVPLFSPSGEPGLQTDGGRQA